MFLPNGTEEFLATEADVLRFGIKIEDGNQLNVWIDDETLYDSFFEVVIKSTLEEELDWYNTTQIKLNY